MCLRNWALSAPLGEPGNLCIATDGLVVRQGGAAWCKVYLFSSRSAYLSPNIYRSTHAVELKTGPRFGVSCVKNLSKFFTVFPILIVFWGIFENTNSVTLCQNSVFAKFGDVKNEVFEKEIAFFFFVGEIETEKRKKENGKGQVVIQKCEKSKKKWIFCKDYLTLFVSGREKKRAFSCTLSVLVKKCFGPKTV